LGILLGSPLHLCYDQGSEGRGHWCTSSEQWEGNGWVWLW
jgi:hypothetical protein